MRMTRQAWGKTDDRGFHPLAHHCMDVAAVFSRMLELPVIKNRVKTAAGRPLKAVDCERLTALAFLHDIGKLHPGFQAKGWPEGLWRGPKRGHLKEGLEFLMLAYRNDKHPFHRTILQFLQWGDAVESLLEVMIAHHGKPVSQPSDPTGQDWKMLPHYDWQAEAHKMDEALHCWFAPAFESGSVSLPNNPPFHHAVAGYVALADWIGSDRRFFEFSEPFDFSYHEKARENAKRALEMLGFDSSALGQRPAPKFSDLTPFSSPNSAQAVVGAVEPDAKLVILEAETGSGKTEAALWRFTQLLAAGTVSGLYFAVPTRAAARQLHRRVNDALCRVFGKGALETVLAIPGMVRAGEAEGRRLPDWKVLWEDHEGPVPTRWAAEHATRFLAAPVAVGTVDQAMLAGLQVKHAHLRGSALSRSLLVIDEVHASDAYMTEVLVHLLQGHLATGGYAMLMSATLGSRARVRWTGESQPDFKDASTTPYPAVWIRGEDAPRIPAIPDRAKKVHLQTISTMAPEDTAKHAVTAAKRGARVLVIRNTVKAAIATWQAVQETGNISLLMQAKGYPALHHGRFAVEDRGLLDAATEAALNPKRMPGTSGRIVIGTQTLEQSLDIDADLLITDLCPMDVLLQRIGRLHRHELPRPKGFEAARAQVLLPEGGLDRLVAPDFENGLGAWKESDGSYNGIYIDLAILELTRQLIVEHTTWVIPAMNRELVEGATHPDRINELIIKKGADWDSYNRTVSGAQAAEEMVAQLCVVDREGPFADLCFPSSDERIMTRLGEEGAILKFNPSTIGPFGQPVTRITLPAHWSHGIKEEDEMTTKREGEELILSIGTQSFRYSRGGLVQEGT